MTAAVSMLVAIPVCLLPSLFWLAMVYRRDDHEREPLTLVLLALLLGFGAAFAVLLLRPLLEERLAPASALVDAFVVTALIEESLKLLALLPLCLHRELDEPLDGVVYGAAVGLGFAAIENVCFCAGGDDALLLLQRAFTATLAHASCTGCLGFACAMARLGSGWRRRMVWPIAGLLLAVAVHGSYDLFLTGGRGRALVALLLVLPAGLSVLALNVRWARARSPQFHPTD